MDELLFQAYAGQEGGDLPYFVGRQYGSGWLRSIARFAFPVVKKLVGAAGRVALNTANDVITKEKEFGKSLKRNAMKEAASSINTLAENTIFASKNRKRHRRK